MLTDRDSSLRRSHLSQGKSTLRQLKGSLRRYHLPLHPTPTGFSKLTFVYELKLRLCSLPLCSQPSLEEEAIQVRFLSFLATEIIEKQLIRERKKTSHQAHSDGFTEVADSRLVAIARRIYPQQVEHIEQSVTQQFHKNTITERLLAMLRHHSMLSYFMHYTTTELLLIRRLQMMLDRQYHH